MDIDVNKIKALCNRFYMKYYPAILNCKPEDLDTHRGIIHTTIPYSTISEFFEYNITDEKESDFSFFKSEIYGIGKNKFRYNEINMEGFDLTKCKTLKDVIYYRELIQQEINKEANFIPANGHADFDTEDYLDFSNIWSYASRDTNSPPIPFAISDLCFYSNWKLDDIASNIQESIMKSKRVKGEKHGLQDPESGNYFYNMVNEYEDPIYGRMEREVTYSIARIVTDYSFVVAKHFEKFDKLFMIYAGNKDESNQILVPNLDLADKFDIRNFFDSIESIGYVSTEVIDEYCDSLKEELQKIIESEIAELYHKYSNATAITENKEPLNLLMPKGLFDLFESDDEENPT